MAQETSDMNEPVLHPAPAEGFGAALKRAREAQGISIGDMAARSRLSVQQVRALESERTAELPEPVYVRAFIRGVASVLGLEPDPLVADYTARYGAASVGVLPDHDPAKETVVRASGRRTGLKAAVVAIAAVLVCAAGWYAWSSMSDGAETQPAAETPVVDAPESVEAARLNRRQPIRLLRRRLRPNRPPPRRPPPRRPLRRRPLRRRPLRRRPLRRRPLPRRPLRRRPPLKRRPPKRPAPSRRPPRRVSAASPSRPRAPAGCRSFCPTAAASSPRRWPRAAARP